MGIKKSLKTHGRDIDWSIYINADGTWNDSDVMMALLHDIREELKRLNNLLHCRNFVEIPTILRDVRKNTTKRKRPKKQAPKLRVVNS